MGDKRRIFEVALALLIVLFIVASEGRADIGEDLRLAEQYMRHGQNKKAMEIYEALYLQHPADKRVITGLRKLYRAAGSWDKLVTLLRNEVALNPEEPTLRRELGDALYYADRIEEARETWESIIEKAPHWMPSYQLVADAYLEKGLADEAMAVYRNAKRALKDDELFAEELANLYRVRRDYRGASEELLLHLRGDPPKRFKEVLKTFIEYVREDDEAWEPVVDVLRGAVRDRPEDANLNHLLGEILLEGGHATEALQYYKAIDRLEESQRGDAILRLAQKCDKMGFHRTALDANRFFLETYPQHEKRFVATLGVARALRGLGQFQDAIDHYREIAAHGEREEDRIEARFQIAEIYLHDAKEVDEASRLYRALMEEHPQSKKAPYAALRLGDCLFLGGELENARETYLKVGELQRGEKELREEARYKMAEIRYFQGEFDKAAEQFDQLIELYPKGVYVNDALEHSVIIEEGLESRRVLTMFAQAQLLARQGKHAAAVPEYREVLAQPEAVLLDRSLFRLAELHGQLGKHQEAIDLCRQLIAHYPDSPLCDMAQARIGQIYEEGMRDTRKAIQEYKNLLTDYPQSLLVSHVRTRIRELQGE